jgi:glutathione S-transferase
MTALLVLMPYSPWSERARWALDHHHIAYRPIEHLPMVYEPVLRVATAAIAKNAERLFIKPTVPILVHDGKLFADSLSIAEHAEEIGDGTQLFPDAVRADVLGWVDAADKLLDSGRSRMMDRLVDADAALLETLPPPLRLLGPVAVASARLGARFVRQKHADRTASAAEHEARMDAVLDRIERALDGKDYLTGSFTFADAAIAAALDVVNVRASSPLGEASRKVWGEPQLAKVHPRVIAWRDRVYAERR